jgi:hypothetical protein
VHDFLEELLLQLPFTVAVDSSNQSFLQCNFTRGHSACNRPAVDLSGGDCVSGMVAAAAVRTHCVYVGQCLSLSLSLFRSLNCVEMRG